MAEVYIDAIWISVAFICGLIAKRINLPVLTGFLITGIVLNFFGIKDGAINNVLPVLSELGVMLLLFTIGLKIKVKQLIKPEILVTASANMVLSVISIASFILLFSYFSVSYFTNLDAKAALLIGFALSFSSTVFVIKILEERGELTSFHGKIAVGILIIQDFFAVAFLSVSGNYIPSPWIFGLPIYLFTAQRILFYILDESGHGELLTVFGFFATFVGGAMVFKFVGLKPDLGALVIGMLLVNHKKAKELYDRMMNYKDFFLIAFFISIGLQGVPTFDMIMVALLLLLFALVKGGFFIYLLSYFNIKARTAFLTSVSLSNFSEFGLITIYAGVQSGLVGPEWLTILAIVMSFSFFAASPVNANVHSIFDRFKSVIMLLNRGKNFVDNEIADLGNAEYLIIGMGSIGFPAYKHLDAAYPGKVLGIDYNHDRIEAFQKQGINAAWGDAINNLFWIGADFSKVKIVLLGTSDFQTNFNVLIEINKLSKRDFKVSAISHYEDEAIKFKEHNVDFVYDYKSSIGDDFAEKAIHSVS
jgi:glutathione-regulated potassium-efflux system ancillary protein KefC